MTKRNWRADCWPRRDGPRTRTRSDAKQPSQVTRMRPPGAPQASRSMNGLACTAFALAIVAALLLAFLAATAKRFGDSGGVFGGCFLEAVLAVIFGHLDYTHITKSQGRQRGETLAIAACVLGYCVTRSRPIVIISLVPWHWHLTRPPGETHTQQSPYSGLASVELAHPDLKNGLHSRSPPTGRKPAMPVTGIWVPPV